jgi:hypothetical protein
LLVLFEMDGLSDLQRCLADLRERMTDGDSDVLLRRAIALADALGRDPSPAPSRVVVGPHGAWFAVDSQARVSLQRRRALPGILFALARASTDVETGRRSLSYSSLLDAGWPGERVLPKAAELRVRAAISALRTLGLRELVVTTSFGYALEARVSFAPDPLSMAAERH